MFCALKLGPQTIRSSIAASARRVNVVRAMASKDGPKKVLIVGGVAGGASCAARLRRLSETADITIFERGQYVSFANCGLPYHVSGVIAEEAKLLVATPAKFNNWFNIKVRESTEVISINREAKTVVAKDLKTGKEETHSYDKLVLAPGAAAIKPPLPGVDLPGIFAMKTIPDTRAVREHIEAAGVKRAVVVGGGFIGLEMAENLAHRGIAVTLVEAGPQVMAPLDIEMAALVHAHLKRKGVELHLGDGVAGFEQGPGGKGLLVKTAAGKAHAGDMVMLVIGVRPETGLAKAAGLALGARGGIAVDDRMRTSDPNILAVGDAVEVKDWVTGQQALVPLAGPANRQGRIAADVIMGREQFKFRGVQGTAVVGVFGMTVAATGGSEKALKRAGIKYEKVYTHANNHAGYYPGAATIDFKLIFCPDTGKILGCQAVGEAEGVEKRVDVVAMAMQMGGTVFDLEEAELCYAPQYGSAKDVINLAGMVASNVVRGDMKVAHWQDLDLAALGAPGSPAVVLDVRETAEVANGPVPGALNIPLPTLRAKIAAGELDKSKKYLVTCAVGLRGYLATRQLAIAGYDVANISGGFKSFGQLKTLGASAGLAKL
mmetsp:Transcript_20799/g.52880  ORF Transcript_20799/g.52880 Transcript_20799/m.52880 type:complete len:603 (-) Transcript_20799:157-1965(-)|eukprot:CAMPEP_0202863728 /NCGR_PEP_ID=MMETSP1391-20130828/4247_1 /ASSEMBLY_ACC=CAM_ASM_000867 /TAXON_ID=1034604 /ORGANISM="Chlamydomonas leiostraca, Strain SAG 11-49" /LENGTH=602 /DNA_ID=CAMNT_0049543391 /DNA_START=160 /DNA_END=1968 /DNA_ORIENTATION=-